MLKLSALSRPAKPLSHWVPPPYFLTPSFLLPWALVKDFTEKQKKQKENYNNKEENQNMRREISWALR
jgi:hypothetical protein